ncbi:MAG: hypothetical protein F6K25_24725 [Okeania sp. SIO2G4]|nr:MULTISPECIES: hypothetical protein [unclassified Okeania]NEP05541.1 hypothetical protein [Okeania sp. SIO4D6]NEP73941.1 hypothetical protein [Okeania sp. SIO2G5]NEP94755.1 hypothetical protein [Okeania sp. SIO2F5]NEQ93688.1 hypothetical protein [Okeania sp. SIO2G4]
MGKTPPLSFMAKSCACSAVNLTGITACSLIMPVSANLTATVGAINNWLLRKILILRPVPARFLVSSANFVAASGVKRTSIFQLSSLGTGSGTVPPMCWLLMMGGLKGF